MKVCAGAGAFAALGYPATGMAAQTDPWSAGDLAHLIPTASHERFLIKASFKTPLTFTPRLTGAGKPVDGFRTDSQGRFWRFDAPSLSPSTKYELRLTDPGGGPLCGAWPLETLPAPSASPDRLRILAYTCGGGYDGPAWNGKTFFLDMTARRRLLARGLSFQPDVLIANGDQIYWDLKTTLNKPFAEFMKTNFWPKFGGAIDVSVPMLHPKNAAIFTGVCDYQIPGLYGTTLRSTPAFFISDDHDTFENDEYDSKLATMPPDIYGVRGAEQTQHLYYPEFLPDANRPDWLPGADKAGRPAGANMLYGTVRYGTLFEAVLYDCRRYVDYKGDHAKILPTWVEDWIIARTRAEDTTHFLQAPSLPFAFSSGKLGDWYPDMADPSGHLVLSRDKPGWQRGWFAQHQRLIEALASQKRRSAMILEGDFHASAAGRVHRSGELALQTPVDVILGGTLGTGDITFPSSFRSVDSKPSQLIGMDEQLKPTEKNGFSVIDVTPDKVVYRMFTWRPPQRPEEIDTMEPALTYEVPRRA